MEQVAGVDGSVGGDHTSEPPCDHLEDCRVLVLSTGMESRRGLWKAEENLVQQKDKTLPYH